MVGDLEKVCNRETQNYEFNGKRKGVKLTILPQGGAFRLSGI